MQLRPGPARKNDANGIYLSPNDPFAVDWQPKGEGVVHVSAPKDLVKRDERDAEVAAVRVGAGSGATAAERAELERVRARVSYLEGALAQSERIESAAQSFSDTLEKRSAEERARHVSELDGLRTLLDQKERELRTLALEMGKVQGRLEAAEARLQLTGGSPSSSARATSAEFGARAVERQDPGADRSRGAFPASMAWTQTTVGMFLVGVITVGVVALVLIALAS
ncbi:hypothetical protein Pla163_12640 [Planctomycetes bacterium Pla163]|uniref:Uncharacterized protein n=1 Tax=Rohdeia mirabilis TaxID=2528008 RepID=A0A518CY49_9BACT|nr:hypothetical protein Pla163_12640 [Planctomycetes bacterium Pla163]